MSLSVFSKVEECFDLTDIEKDTVFQAFCQNIDMSYKTVIEKLKQITIKLWYDCDNYGNTLDQLFNVQKYANEISVLEQQIVTTRSAITELKNTIVLKRQILNSSGVKRHSINTMLPQQKLKHVRSCSQCDHHVSFDKVTDEEILNNVVDPALCIKLDSLTHTMYNIVVEIRTFREKITILKSHINEFMHYYQGKYLKHKVLIRDCDTQIPNITFCIDVGGVEVEIPFTEVVSMAIKAVAKESFERKL